jgi:succinate-semialdehyde dehydrogenase
MSTPQRAAVPQTDNEVSELIAKARAAQATYEAFSQEQVDAIVRDMAKYVYDNAEALAKMAVEETGIGNYEDKVLKKKGKARVIWNNLKGKKSRGVIGEDKENNLVFVAKPMGVVGAICPVTNPIATPMCNGMFALKAGNAVIFAPHPKAQKCTDHLTKEFMKIVKKHGGPDNLIQTIKKGSIEKTQELMKSVDVVVATGGGAMVKSAYSSGKPSYGVGAGNVPVIIDRGVDFKDAVGKIVTGAAFDNGIICSHEQFVLTPEEKFDETVKLFKDTGKVWFTDDEKQIQKLSAAPRARSARWPASTCPRAPGSSCCPRRAPERTTSSRRRSSAPSSRSCRTRRSPTPSRRRSRTYSSRARATRRPCTRTTRTTFARPAWSFRSAGSS